MTGRELISHRFRHQQCGHLNLSWSSWAPGIDHQLRERGSVRAWFIWPVLGIYLRKNRVAPGRCHFLSRTRSRDAVPAQVWTAMVRSEDSHPRGIDHNTKKEERMTVLPVKHGFNPGNKKKKRDRSVSSLHAYAQFMQGCCLNTAAGMKNSFRQVCLLSRFFPSPEGQHKMRLCNLIKCDTCCYKLHTCKYSIYAKYEQS